MCHSKPPPVKRDQKLCGKGDYVLLIQALLLEPRTLSGGRAVVFLGRVLGASPAAPRNHDGGVAYSRRPAGSAAKGRRLVLTWVVETVTIACHDLRCCNSEIAARHHRAGLWNYARLLLK